MALYIRSTKPEKNNIYYNNNNGGCSTCISGNAKVGREPGLNVLPNCVGLACGAFNETINSVKGKNKQYYALNCRAERFLQVAKQMGLQTLPREATPTIGSIMVWRLGKEDSSADGAGHVVYVYDVIDANTVCTIESNWSGPVYRKHGPGGDKPARKRGSNGNWGYNSLYYMGCVVNPVVDDEVVSNNYRPYISNITEENNKIIINGNSNNIENMVKVIVKCQFKDEDNNTVDTVYITVNKSDLLSNFQFIVSVDDINTPFIQVDIVKYMKKGDVSWEVHGSTFSKELKVENNINCVNIYTDNNKKFNQYLPYIYTNGVWTVTKPYIYTNGEWVEILNKRQ